MEILEHILSELLGNSAVASRTLSIKSSKFDMCLQGNLQVEILIKSLETRQQRYNFQVFATGPGS